MDRAQHEIDISRYADYRSYLTDCVAHRQATQKGFSLRWLNAWCQFSSPSYFQSILAGKRSLTHTNALQVSSVLRHSEFEAEYFRLLVKCNNAKDEREIQESARDLEHLRKLREIKEIGQEARLFLSRWETVAVYCYLTDRNHEAVAFSQILSRFSSNIPADDLSEVLRMLVYIDFAKCETTDGEKRYSCVNDSILANKKIANEDIRRFHKSVVEFAAISLKQGNEKKIEFNATTIRTRKDKLEQMKAYLAEVRFQFCARFHDESGDEVFHLETMLVPFTNVEESSNGHVLS